MTEPPGCHIHLVPLSCPPGPSVILTWFPCHAHLVPLSYSPGSPVMPIWFPCHTHLVPLSCRYPFSHAPPFPSLSFPQVFSGNPVFFSCVLFICVTPAWGKPLDSRLKTSGTTEGGKNIGNDRRVVGHDGDGCPGDLI